MKYVKEFGLYVDTDCNLYSFDKDYRLVRLPLGPGGRQGAYFKVSYYPVDENGMRCGKQTKAYVHRVIATAFVPNPENKPTVDHINRDGHDNRPENLRWLTNSEQQRNRSVCDSCKEKYGINWYTDPKEYRRRRFAVSGT